MKSPLAFGSACNRDDIPGIYFMQRTGTTEHTEHTEAADQGTKKSGKQGSRETPNTANARKRGLKPFLDPARVGYPWCPRLLFSTVDRSP
jgi:hypothetical protein